MDLVENDINALMKIPIKKLKPNLIDKEHIATEELKTRKTSLWPLLRCGHYGHRYLHIKADNQQLYDKVS